MTEPAFFDQAKIQVQAGKGGNGVVSFRREKYVPYGGPDGGNGGRGGDVYIVANRHLNTLIQFTRQRHFKAESGGNGDRQKMQGKQGQDLQIQVPLGTLIYDARTNELLADLVNEGQMVMVAKGGRGGRGNAVFASPTNQAPRIAEKGEPGETRSIKLELKLIADVGLIGVPNAGKSTLLATISAARPKIADYPFTTLVPNLGVVTVDHETFVAADIPGLIEGAHEGVGLGIAFLRHVERTRVLIHLLDGAAEDPIADMDTINAEMALYSAKLAAKQQIIALNKMDLPQAQEHWPKVQAVARGRGLTAMAISAVTGQGVNELLYAVMSLLKTIPKEPVVQEVKVFRPAEVDEDAFTIEREGHVFRLRGRRVQRAAAMTDWNNPDTVARFERILKAMGIMQALEEAGIEPGDTVAIDNHELEWQQ